MEMYYLLVHFVNGTKQLSDDTLFPYRQRGADVSRASLAWIEPIDVIGPTSARFNKRLYVEKKAKLNRERFCTRLAFIMIWEFRTKPTFITALCSYIAFAPGSTAVE